MFEINLDSSIIISTLTGDIHSQQVIKAISKLSSIDAQIYVSLVVYSEIWTGIELIDDPITKQKLINNFEQMLFSIGTKVVSDNLTIAKRAAKAQAEYKKRGGYRDVLIPDFLIGANAEFYSKKILTANPRDFMKCFPEVEVFTPIKIMEEL
ncbi:type II toxin-antitoxin system VapC family toxin [Candidatus Desantisbacteria bacterium]|nr:type II toxin-antitoxin system VapC family toxin [Candidatus Desantisbacteria bacterium]